MMAALVIQWLALASLLAGGAVSLDNGLALTPPMGWMSWERYRCNVDCTTDPYNCISEELYMEMADRLVDQGYKDLGYEFVNIDVHSRGLKLGIYGDIGTMTCGGYPGSYGHIETDAMTYAEWGVDMVKVDGCYANETVFAEGYPAMGKALNATGRPIVYSCSWPAYLKDVRN
ncbi:Alpha-N-acetylgalactosaminidase [Geodia barretti]|uniref:Alpha-galactosidase n=1 Tax=Geodia barretti TaxID=519541 RepID=A0AA35QWE3_GEOBA|nr:Alpha-N-acetylgalactosaminidase [Geodia barretti]